MPKGGRRAGAGRKPGSTSKLSRRSVVVDMRGLPHAATLPAVSGPVDDPDGLLAPPDGLGLSMEAFEIWRRLAPYGLKERTLTSSRTPGFAKLCQEWAYCAAFEAQIQQLGVATEEADRLLKRLNDYKKQLDRSLGNFNLRSFGKPVAPEKTKVVSNPFAAKFGGAKA